MSKYSDEIIKNVILNFDKQTAIDKLQREFEYIENKYSNLENRIKTANVFISKNHNSWGVDEKTRKIKKILVGGNK